MAKIKATCPYCGDVDLTSRDVELRIADNNAWASYQFRCPKCTVDVEKPAGGEVVRLLRGAGVKVCRMVTPTNRCPQAPPLTPDDVLDLHLWLADHPRVFVPDLVPDPQR